MQQKKPDVGVIIPAYNESKNIEKIIKTLHRLPCIDEILVVDDGSTDDTAKIAKKAGAKVISIKKNMGKAYAMKIGYLLSNNHILVFLDGDIKEGVEQVDRLVNPILEGKADAVIARFPSHKEKGGLGLVKALAQIGLFILTGKTLSSVLSGQRAFHRSILRPELFDYHGYGIEFGMTVDLLNKNIRITEVGVTMKHCATGRNLKGFLHRFRQFSDILKVIIKKLF